MPDIPSLIAHSETHKKELRLLLKKTRPHFPGMNGQIYSDIIDTYHGETGFRLDPPAETALYIAWDQILQKNTPPEYQDPHLYDKHQPFLLRALSANKLFSQFYRPLATVPGIQVKPNEVLVCPYSSTILLEEALATIAEPDGSIICPEGFYKNVGLHIKKLGLTIVTCPTTSDSQFKISAPELAAALQQTASSSKVCGVLLTLPGNPVVANYSLAELQEIGRVLAEADVPIICDMAFGRLVENHIPLASLTVATSKGDVKLYDKILTITGNSKGYNAFGPCKFGAACSGNSAWLQLIERRLVTSFQRETTHLVRAILESTTDEYFQHNRKLLRQQQQRAQTHITRINQQYPGYAVRRLGAPEGPFATLEFNPKLLLHIGVHTSAQLEELLLRVAGIDSVALDRTGSHRLGVRLNIIAPRKGPGKEQPELIDELFDRIEKLLAGIKQGHFSQIK